MIMPQEVTPCTLTAVIETCLYGDDLAALEDFYTRVLGSDRRETAL